MNGRQFLTYISTVFLFMIFTILIALHHSQDIKLRKKLLKENTRFDHGNLPVQVYNIDGKWQYEKNMQYDIKSIFRKKYDDVEIDLTKSTLNEDFSTFDDKKIVELENYFEISRMVLIINNMKPDFVTTEFQEYKSGKNLERFSYNFASHGMSSRKIMPKKFGIDNLSNDEMDTAISEIESMSIEDFIDQHVFNRNLFTDLVNEKEYIDDFVIKDSFNYYLMEGEDDKNPHVDILNKNTDVDIFNKNKEENLDFITLKQTDIVYIDFDSKMFQAVKRNLSNNLFQANFTDLYQLTLRHYVIYSLLDDCADDKEYFNKNPKMCEKAVEHHVNYIKEKCLLKYPIIQRIYSGYISNCIKSRVDRTKFNHHEIRKHLNFLISQ